MVLTIRNIPADLEEKLKQQAATIRASLNQTVIRLLQDTLGTGTDKPRMHHDLDWFIGCWSADEASDFDQAVQDQRGIDQGLWK